MGEGQLELPFCIIITNLSQLSSVRISHNIRGKRWRLPRFGSYPSPMVDSTSLKITVSSRLHYPVMDGLGLKMYPENADGKALTASRKALICSLANLTVLYEKCAQVSCRNIRSYAYFSGEREAKSGNFLGRMALWLMQRSPPPHSVRALTNSARFVQPPSILKRWN